MDTIINTYLKELGKKTIWDFFGSQQENDKNFSCFLEKFLSIVKKEISQADVKASLLSIINAVVERGAVTSSSETISDYFDRDKLRNEICELVKSLPKKYTIKCYLPNVSNIAITEKVIQETSVIKFERGIIGRENYLSDRLLELQNHELNTGYIEIPYSGYLNENHYSGVLRQLKQIIFLGLCLDVFTVKNNWHEPQKNNVIEVLGFQKNHGSDPKKFNIELGRQDSLFFYKIFSTKKTDDMPKFENKIQKLFFNPLQPRNNEIERIASSLFWGYEAKSDENQTFQFIKTCIALEAILDDKIKGKGKIKRLCEKLKLLLPTPEEDLVKNFTKVYDVRSRLVHGSQPDLEPNDVQWLEKADNILKNVIQKKLEQL